MVTKSPDTESNTNTAAERRRKGREKSQRWRRANPEKAKVAVRRWQRANPEKAKAATKRWERENLPRLAAGARRRRRANPQPHRDAWQRYRLKYPARYLASQHKSRQALKDSMFAALGTRCTCCSETVKLFLTLDHIGGKTTNSWYRYMLTGRRKGWPKDQYQMLCFNCNAGKADTGICPHMFDKLGRPPMRHRPGRRRLHQVPSSTEEVRRRHERTKETRRTHHHKQRQLMFEALGSRCVCCGESILEFLCLDHIGGVGVKIEDPIKGLRRMDSTGLIRKAKHEGWPPSKYRILCFNCNHAARFGPCPHTLKSAES